MTQQAASGARLVVTVSADGVVTAETQGILGDRCLEYVSTLEDLVDGRAVSSRYTADLDRDPDAQRTQHETSDVELA